MSICDRVVLAVDFSEPSKVAARAAFKLATMVGASRLTLIHSARPVVFPAGALPKVRERLESLRARIHRAVEEQLEVMCRELAAPAGLTIDHRIVEGHPAEAIPKAAADMQASLLLIGSHGRRGVKRWVSGSIAESMLERVDMPTLVMLTGADGVPPEAELDDLQHVLIAVDDSEQSEATARAGFELARSFAHARPKVVLLHVVEGTGIEVIAADDPDVSEYAQLLEEAGRRATEELASRCDSGGLEVEVRIAHGHPEEAILHTARALPARLIVVGTCGRRLPVLLGSTAAHVVRHTDVPVLVVPHPRAR